MPAEMNTRKLFSVSGTWTAIATPFLEGPEPEVDFAALDRLVDAQIAAGVDAVVVCGTTGESATLSHDEHERVIAHVVRHAAGRVPVVAGTGSNSTAEAERLTRHAAESGADAALLVAPYYNRPTQRMLVEHFRRVIERAYVPIVLYNIPSRTGVNVEPETVAELRRRFPRQVIAVKEASGSLEQVARIRSLCDITVLCGDDTLTLPMMAAGASGVVSVASNVVPKLVGDLVRSAIEGDFASARAIDDRLRPLYRALFQETNPVPVKCALRLLGIGNGNVRGPLLPALPETEKALKAALGALGVQTQG